MTKVFENFDDQHVRGVVFYGKTSDHKLYVDAAMTEQATEEALNVAFKKNQAFIVEGADLLAIVKVSAEKAYTISQGESALALVEWAAKAAE